MRKLKLLYVVLIVLALFALHILVHQEEQASDTNGWNLILINEDYYIPRDYKVELKSLENGEKVDKRICEKLLKMFEDAKKDGIYMVVADGYRSKAEQKEMMEAKADEYQERVLLRVVAEQLAKKWVAIPGTSEHQLGIAVDINADAINSSGAEVYSWLAQNAHKYGFIQRYPSDKVKITGISYEPWHYRYVGDEAAKEMFEKGICLEEYIELLER